MPHRIFLAKILDERHAKDFLDGNLFMNTDAYFAQLDTADELRADSHEGLDEAWQVKQISIMADSGEYVPIGSVQNPVGYRYGQKENPNILCLYSQENTKSPRSSGRGLFPIMRYFLNTARRSIPGVGLMPNIEGGVSEWGLCGSLFAF